MRNEKLGIRNNQSVMSVSARLLAVLFLLSGLCLNAVAQEVAVYPQMGHTDWVVKVAFSPNGKHVLSGSEDGTSKLWDINTGKVIRTFLGRGGSFSPDGKHVITYSSDKTIKLWDTNTGREIRIFSGHENWIDSITFSPDGKKILSGSFRDGLIKLWDINTGREIKTFSSNTKVKSLIFSPDSRQFISIARSLSGLG